MHEVDKLMSFFNDILEIREHVTVIVRDACQISLPTRNTCGQDQGQSLNIHLELIGHIQSVTGGMSETSGECSLC